MIGGRERGSAAYLAVLSAAVIIAHLAKAPQQWLDGLALAFVLLRVVYTLFYIYNKPTLRSLAWTAGFLCVIGLFVISW